MRTGISIVDEVSWGTHMCLFYETKKDLLEALVPYFKAGLENRELCLWMVSGLLTKGDALGVVRAAIPDFDRGFGPRCLKIVSRGDWQGTDSTSDLRKLAQRLDEQCTQALRQGCAGLRVSADTSWLRESKWKDFHRNEDAMNQLVRKRRMLFLCSYPLSVPEQLEAARLRQAPGLLLDLIGVHDVAVARRLGRWQRVQTFEQRSATHRFEAFVQAVEDYAIFTLDPEGRVASWNAGAERMYGYTAHEILGQPYPVLCVPKLALAGKFPKSLRLAAARGHVTDKEWCVREDHSRFWGKETITALRQGRLGLDGFIVVVEDLTERQQTEERLRRSSEQLRALTARLESMREQERIHLAREIHDQMAQGLTALKMDLARIERKLQALKAPGPAGPILDQVAGATRLVDQIAAGVQQIAAELRPAALDKLGLGAAIREECERFGRRSGIRCHYRLPRRELALSPEAATAFFRILQEALTNVVRHAQASEVQLKVSFQRQWVVLQVRDNGRGITEAERTKPEALGLLGITERAALLGGQAAFERGPQRGTVITIRLPRSGQPSHAQPPV